MIHYLEEKIRLKYNGNFAIYNVLKQYERKKVKHIIFISWNCNQYIEKDLLSIFSKKKKVDEEEEYHNKDY